MAKGNPIIEQQVSFVWGQTNDRYAWPANSFWNSKNVDIRRNTREVTLSGTIVNNVYATGGIPMAIYGDYSTNQLAFCSNGYISSASNATLRAHSSINTWSSNYRNVAPYGIISGKQALLILASGYVHTIAYDSASLPWTVVEDVRKFVNNDNNKPYCIFNGDLLIGDGHLIQKISFTPPTTYVPVNTPTQNFWDIWAANWALIGIDSTESILWIFELWDQIVFFTQKAQYFWDWFNSAYDRRVPRDTTIVSVAQFKTSFIVLTNDWTFMTLRETSTGYDRVEIQKEEIYGSNKTRRLDQTYSYTNAMAVKNWITYFWGWANWELNSYGYYNPWMNKVLMKHITGTGWITCVYKDAAGSLLYYGWYTGTTYYVGYLENRMNATSPYTDKDGLIELTPHLGDSRSTNSEMIKIRIGYKLDSSICYMPIYSRLDEELDKFTFYATSYTILPTAWATYTHNTSTYTVLSTMVTAGWGLLLTCQRTSGTALPTATGSLTKTAWTGDATITFTYYVNYRCIWLVDGWDATDLASYRKSLAYNTQFNEVQFAIGMVWNNTYTPRFKDFIWVYNDILNDL